MQLHALFVVCLCVWNLVCGGPFCLYCVCCTALLPQNKNPFKCGLCDCQGLSCLPACLPGQLQGGSSSSQPLLFLLCFFSLLGLHSFKCCPSLQLIFCFPSSSLVCSSFLSLFFFSLPCILCMA